MRIRVLSAFLIFALATWLPVAGQQPAPGTSAPPATPSSPGPAKNMPGCTCCSHDTAAPDSEKTEKHDHASMACCAGKSSGEMTCGNAKSGKPSAGMECCKSQDAKLCAAKDGKSCCDLKNAKSCCGKDGIASDSKDGKDCCAGKSSSCNKHAA